VGRIARHGQSKRVTIRKKLIRNIGDQSDRDVTITRISQMTSFALACDLRYTPQNKGILPIHAMAIGEPDG
jgi:hypothetical protein